MTVSAIYYECRVTVEPVFNERLELFASLCAPLGFKVAKLLMDKGPSTKDSFCTAHGADCAELELRMRGLVDRLRDAGFSVYRNKIEAVVLDERHKR